MQLKRTNLYRSAAIAVIGFIILPAAWTVSGTSVPQDNLLSIYTSLTKKDCKVLKVDDETGSTVSSCPGIAGYGLHVLDDDSRQSVTIITPDNQEFPLNYWHVITPYFSRLGDKAEWRVVQKDGKPSQPIAVIVRVNAQEQKDIDAEVINRSYLAVAKITSAEICVTDRILPGTAANEEARIAADNAAKRACLQEIQY